MYASSTRLKGPPSPRRKDSRARSAILRRRTTASERLAFAATMGTSKLPRDAAGPVAMRRVDVKCAGPFVGDRVQTVSVGQPETLRETRSEEVPKTRTRADAVWFLVVCTVDG